MALPIGTILDGKFKIVQVLGEGGMGIVYKAEQVGKLGYFRAVKELVISSSTSEEDRKIAIERFDREIDLLYNLKHAHIPSLILSFQERNNYYFVMEFVPGHNLETLLEENKGPLDEEKVIRWMMVVCNALAYIHSRTPPIILRDLKPGNIMVTPEGDVQLIDFGIARKFDPRKRTNTENLGTIAYASPEHLGSITAPGQRRNPQNPGKLVQTDARSDIYSLGATMYHLLTNYEPDPIKTPTPGSIRAKNPRLSTVQVGGKSICPIERVLIKAMQQDPALRFQNVDAMCIALQHCLSNSNIPTPTVRIPVPSPQATIGAPVRNAVCPKCGYQNRPHAKFCKRDGQPLTQGATAVPPLPLIPASGARSGRPSMQVKPTQPRFPTIPSPALDLSQVYQEGIQYLNNRNYPAAVNQLKMCRPSYDVFYNLGRAYRQYGQSVKENDTRLFNENIMHAIEQFESASRYKRDSIDVYFQLGMCYRDQFLSAQATTAFKQALALTPDDSAIYYQLGMVAMEQGHGNEAEAAFLAGLKVNPDHVLILIALGRLYTATNQVSAAISVLRQATQRESILWEGWYELGRAHMKKREWSVALSALERARQCNSDVSAIYSAMATCYYKMNNKAESWQKVQEALRYNSKNAEALRLQKQLL